MPNAYHIDEWIPELHFQTIPASVYSRLSKLYRHQPTLPPPQALMRQALILLLHCTKDTVKFGDKDLSHDHDLNLTSCTKAEHTIHIKNNTVPLLPYTKYYRTPNDLPRVLLTFGSTKVSMNPEVSMHRSRKHEGKVLRYPLLAFPPHFGSHLTVDEQML